MNLRKYAQNKPCQIRLPGCDGGGETTVLCHWRDACTGMGAKEADVIAAWGCVYCHSAVDGRMQIDGWTSEQIRTAFLKAIIRTQRELIRSDILKW